MALLAKGGQHQRQGLDPKLVVVALLTSAAWILLDWARGGVLDVARLITGGLFVLTLLIVWHVLELSFAALHKQYELKSGLQAFDDGAGRVSAQFRRLDGERARSVAPTSSI